MLDRESFDDAIKLLVQNNYVICNADRLRVIAEKTGWTDFSENNFCPRA